MLIYAVLLYITKPTISLPSLHDIISEYGMISGYSVNWGKTQILSISNPKDLGPLPPLFKNITSITYLGITISPNINELYKLNFATLLEDIKHSLQRWNKLPLLLIGRVSTI